MPRATNVACITPVQPATSVLYQLWYKPNRANAMIPPLDIFRLESDGQLIWRASADGDDAAQRRVKILMASEPADYVIYSQETGHKTFVRCKTDA